MALTYTPFSGSFSGDVVVDPVDCSCNNGESRVYFADVDSSDASMDSIGTIRPFANSTFIEDDDGVSAVTPPRVRSNCVVLSGPSGVGKSTLIKRLLADFPKQFAESVSHTTRKKRAGEADGVAYHFVDRGEMEAKVEAGDFLESLEYNGQLYGTSSAAVDAVIETGKICLMDVNIRSAMALRRLQDARLQPYYVFIRPPSLEELETRLHERKTAPEEIERRIAIAKTELDLFKDHPDTFNLPLENNDVDVTYEILKGLIFEATGAGSPPVVTIGPPRY